MLSLIREYLTPVEVVSIIMACSSLLMILVLYFALRSRGGDPVAAIPPATGEREASEPVKMRRPQLEASLMGDLEILEIYDDVIPVSAPQEDGFNPVPGGTRFLSRTAKIRDRRSGVVTLRRIIFPAGTQL